MEGTHRLDARHGRFAQGSRTVREIPLNLLEYARKLKHGEEVVRDWLGNDPRVINQETAQTRADTCLICPNHDPSPKLTLPSALAVKRYLGVKNGLKLRVHGEKRLGECVVCACQMRLKIWEPLSRVKAQMSPDEVYWTECWINTEQNESSPDSHTVSRA
jgi:hypothetical protein